VVSGQRTDVLRSTQFVDVVPGALEVALQAVNVESFGVLLEGTWEGSIGGCGVFEYDNLTQSRNTGDPVVYAKTTTFDSHYHDHDEYFLILEGRAQVVVGDQCQDVGPGDAVAIGMGWHHDIPHILEPLRSVYFHSRLEGQCRPGHLWNHCHGCAKAMDERK